MLFDYNYGQYFTLWDRIGGSFRNPSSFEGTGPLNYVKKIAEEKHNSLGGNGYKNEKLFNGECTKTEQIISQLLKNFNQGKIIYICYH